MRCRWMNSSVLASIVLIAIGLLFLLDNLNIIHVWDVWRFWPAILIYAGLTKMQEREGPSSWIWGSFLMACGAVWLANNFNLIHVGFNTVWPMTLIMFGVMMLTKALEFPAVRNSASNSPGTIHEHVVFSGTKKKLDTPNFEGGDIMCVFGGVDLNLRKCAISSPDHQAVINVAITFGGVEIKIPEGWRVVNRCIAVFGACEDKTVAPRPENGVVAPALIITGHAMFGAVNIEN